ncbi:hypothetical protein DPMN_036642 [Dreissena polymorpha]|uniref:Uncharacterized protein n=1 Tax=Dreissena polymorpha TaxID=45954 RepID=A0A9D4RP09_DREPO|nr:hypothetical protein DPMN_036642 [Dreissena polymorpha]
MLKLFMLNQSDICSGLVDWLLLPADVLITRADIAEVVCVFDYNTIGNEIMNGFEGLNDLINDVSYVVLY